MALQFILGGSGRGKTQYLQELVTREALEHGERTYIYLVPEQFTMQTQKELIKKNPRGGILNIEVQSFMRLAFRVLAETGADARPVLDDMGKTMILKKVLNTLEAKLPYFGRNVHKKGYVQEIKSFLSELLQYGADEETIDDMIRASEKHTALARKLRDILTIYQGFTEYLHENYITTEEIMTVLANVTPQSDFLRESVVCLDGFTGFTPTQYLFLERLLGTAGTVYVSVTMDARASVVRVGEKHSLFYMSRQTIHRLRTIAQKLGVEVCPEVWTGQTIEKTRFAKAPSLFALEEELFRYPHKSYGAKAEEISMHMLRQPEQEVAFAAEQIRNILLDGKCRYRDIAVVTGDLKVYGRLADTVFAQAGIPCFIDRKNSILEHPFVELIESVLALFLSNFERDAVLSFEKNLFSPADAEAVYLLDNFLRATGIRGFAKWQEVWDADRIFAGGGEETLKKASCMLDTVRTDTVGLLGDLYEEIGTGKHTVTEYARALCLWLERGEYYAALKKLAERLAKEDAQLARESEQVYGIVLGVFDRLVELLGGEEMDLKEFKELLDTGFSEARIGLIPPGVDQVVVGDLNRTRLAQVQYLFFLGMDDCNIPGSAGRGGILSDSERLFLSDMEFELAPTTRETVYTEQFYLYLSLTKPSKHLYLTYCSAGCDGKPQNPSYIMERIRELFPQNEVIIEEERTDDSYLLGNTLGKETLIRGLRRQEYGSAKWQEIYSFYQKDEKRKESAKRLADASFYQERKTQLSREAVRALYRDVLTGSTSQFERYSACAFSYFMRYGLCLQERAEHRVELFDVGNIVHEALSLYTKRLVQEGKKWEEISPKEQKARAAECIEQAAARYKDGLVYATERDTALLGRLERLLERSIWAVTKQMERGKFSTVDSEVSFEIIGHALGSDVERRMEADTDALRFIGRIDRVDAMETDSARYIKIVDYKTGKSSLSLSDLYYGLQMQLMIYLQARVTEERTKTKKIVIPAGIFYYNIEDPLVSGVLAEEEIDQAILRELKMDGLVNEDDPILPALDETLASEDGVLPGGVESDILPVATTASAALKKTSKTVTTQDFENLMAYTREKLGEIQGEILDGRIDVNPYRKMDAVNETGCRYCPYHSICRFDLRLPGNAYRVLAPVGTDEIIRKLAGQKKEVQDGETAVDRRTEKGN